MLKIKHLTKMYNAEKGVRDINLEIPAGCIMGLIGVNGAGKTTILKCTAGILDFSSSFSSAPNGSN